MNGPRLVTILFVMLLATPGPAVAASGGVVGHHQAFVGRVNGSFDSAVIAMACFGPISPGETGHPMAGQTLEVLSPPPPIVVGPIHVGNTGSSASRIVAILRGASRTTLARFTNYSETKAIPTSSELPCTGTGVVRFVSRPRSSTSKAAWVTVSFASQP